MIGAAPSSVTFDETFRVDTPDAARVTRAVLVAPTSTTHSTDMNQRVVELGVTRGAGAVSLRAPRNVDTAPRGYYMLFLLDAQGIPSAASWVRLTAETTPDLPAPPPPTAPGGGTGGTPAGTVRTPAGGTTATPGVRRPPAIGTTRFRRIGRFLYVTTRVNVRGRVTIQLDGPPRRITLLNRTVARPTTIRVRVKRVVKPGDRVIVRVRPRTGRPVLRLIGTRTTLKPVVAVRRK